MRQIKLTKGFVAIVDDSDYAELSKFNWRTKIEKFGIYAIRNLPRFNRKRRSQKMHQLLMNVPHGFTVDHRNGDGLDNQRHNLRTATKGQNKANSVNRSGHFKGVVQQQGGRWKARIGTNGTEALGTFPSAIEAARAYNEAAIKRYGEFARLNQLEDQ